MLDETHPTLERGYLKANHPPRNHLLPASVIGVIRLRVGWKEAHDMSISLLDRCSSAHWYDRLQTAPELIPMRLIVRSLRVVCQEEPAT
jgi:hypothetical protein